MRRRVGRLVYCIALLGGLRFAPAQDDASPTAHDTDFLRRYTATYRFSLGRPTAISLTPAGDKALFLRSGPRDFVRSLYEIDSAGGAERLVLSAELLLGGKGEQLSAEELARRERMRLAARGIATYELSRDGQWLLVPLSGRLFVVQRSTGAVRELSTEGRTPLDPQLSPDASQIAWIADGNIYVSAVADGKRTQLSQGATPTLTRGLAEFVAQEEMGRMHGLWWSPDSRQIVFQETDTSGVELWQIADPSRPDVPPQTWRYPRAGTSNAIVRLGIMPATGGPIVSITWDRQQFPYLTNVRWDQRAPLVIQVQNRLQTIVEVLEVDTVSGGTSRLLRETDEAWVDLDPSVPRWTADGKQFLWSTQRRGSAELELRRRDGSLVRPLHDPGLVYRELLAIDEAGSHACIAASEDPSEIHIYRLSLDSERAPQRLTQVAGVHGAEFCRAGVNWVDTVMPRQGEVQQILRRGDGTPLVQLRSQAESPGIDPHLEWTTVTGDTMRAVLVRPDDFTAGRRYPVIVHVYGGPHSQMVMQAGNRYLLDQWIANRGYIVVSLDGRGTPGRTRQWERAIRGNLIELPLADQVRGLKALGEKYPELDLTRVGVFGWSFGGYFSAMAVMRYPEVFHVGVAGAPVTDWRDYDTHYTERYLGLPESNAAGYDANSALTWASDLRRPLLLIHGTADDNVYFFHSLKLSSALLRAGKEHQFLPLVGLTHMVTDPLANQRLYERIMACFDSQLRPGSQ